MGNSRQINFFLTRKDLEELESTLRSAVEFEIINSVAEGGVIEFLPSIRIVGRSNERFKIYLCPPQRANEIILRDLRSQSYKTIDDLRSPVIELDRCFQSSSVLRRWRLYVVTRYYKLDKKGVKLVSKGDEFLSWSNSVFKLARKVMTKAKDSFFYYGHEAAVLKALGLLDFPPI